MTMARRSWSAVAAAMRDPSRSDFAFVPHQYVFAPAEVVAAALTPTESTPINSNIHQVEERGLLAAQRNAYYALHLGAIGLSAFCCVWLSLFPISPNRLYNMQVDVFNTNHQHATFFFHECLYLGVVFGAAVAGYLGDRIGRAGTLELASVPYVMGWLFVGIAYGEATVLFGRYLLGVSAGLMMVVAPIYVAEITSAKTRGRMLCVLSLLGGLARLCYIALGGVFMTLSHHYPGFNLNEWKVLALASLLPGLLLLLLLQALPDSPTWLVLRYDDRDAAFGILHRLFSDDYRRAELEVNSIIHANVLSAGVHAHHATFFRPLMLCVGLFTLRAITALLCAPTLSATHAQTFVGTVFGIDVDVSEEQLLGVLAFVWTAASIGMLCCLLLIDVRGRVATMQFGCGMCVVGCVLLLLNSFAPRLPQFQLTESGSALMLLIAAGHQIGLGIGPLVLLSELFPARRRIMAASLVLTWEALVTIGASQGLNWLREAMSPPQVFALGVLTVLACNALGALIAWLYLPETSQRSLQAIEAILAGWQPATPPIGRSCVRLSSATDSVSFGPTSRSGYAAYGYGT